LSAEVDLLRSYVRTRDTALTERGHSIDSLQAQLDAIRRAVLPQTAMSDSEQSFFTSLLGKPAVVENTQPLSAGTVEILQALDQQLAELQVKFSVESVLALTIFIFIVCLFFLFRI
jgi:hypothetical protein